MWNAYFTRHIFSALVFIYFFFSGGRKVWYDGKLKHGKALKMEWKVSGRGRVWILKAAFGT